MVIHADDKELFLKTLNKSGFLLEDKVWKVLSGLNFQGIERSKVIDHRGERVEIDFIFEHNKHYLIGECKKTDYSWVFSKAEERSDVLNLINDSSKGMKVKTRGTSDFKTAWMDIALMIGEDGKLGTNRNGVPQVSTKDIHSNIKQVLKETEAYLSENRCIDGIVMPIIVTNAKLFYLRYTKSNLNGDSNLENYDSMEEVKGLVYNFPEILKWDRDQQTIRNEIDTKEHHIKSIFIVNINHLKEFIDKMIDQDL